MAYSSVRAIRNSSGDPGPGERQGHRRIKVEGGCCVHGDALKTFEQHRIEPDRHVLIAGLQRQGNDVLDLVRIVRQLLQRNRYLELLVGHTVQDPLDRERRQEGVVGPATTGLRIDGDDEEQNPGVLLIGTQVRTRDRMRRGQGLLRASSASLHLDRDSASPIRLALSKPRVQVDMAVRERSLVVGGNERLQMLAPGEHAADLRDRQRLHIHPPILSAASDTRSVAVTSTRRASTKGPPLGRTPSAAPDQAETVVAAEPHHPLADSGRLCREPRPALRPLSREFRPTDKAPEPSRRRPRSAPDDGASHPPCEGAASPSRGSHQTLQRRH